MRAVCYNRNMKTYKVSAIIQYPTDENGLSVADFGDGFALVSGAGHKTVRGIKAENEIEAINKALKELYARAKQGEHETLPYKIERFSVK